MSRIEPPRADPLPAAPPPRWRGRRRLGLLAAVALLAAALAALGLAVDGAALRERLAEGAEAITGWADARPVAAAVLFLAAAALGKISPLPGGMVVMLSGGFLFGPWLGGTLAAAGAALAAGAVAALGRLVLGPPGRRRPRPKAGGGDVLPTDWRRRLDAATVAVERNGFAAILALRLLPMTPAWLANLLPLVVAIPTLSVMLATFLGVLPLSLVTAAVGSRLADLAQATRLDWRMFLAPETLVPLALLTAAALVPVALSLRRRGGRRG